MKSWTHIVRTVAVLLAGAATGWALALRTDWTPVLPYARGALPLILVTLALCITPHRKDT